MLETFSISDEALDAVGEVESSAGLMDIVVTTIAPPTTGMAQISDQLDRRGGCLWVIGDRKGPFSYDLKNVRFYSIDQQLDLPFSITRRLPEKHYARKNLGYLLAIQSGVQMLLETDDDNIPLSSFWEERQATQFGVWAAGTTWVNAYRYFSKERIWPRGYPLDELQASFALKGSGEGGQAECFIQQALANENPDVDAIYRLTGALPLDFDNAPPLLLKPNNWCPFNSQNTTWFAPAFPLLYLPVHCTFRMTDIWRSFVAQRCLWEMKSNLAFTSATVYQQRNEHNLMRDFEDEVPGYLKNKQICEILGSLRLRAGSDRQAVVQNLLACYEGLAAAGIFPKEEIELVQLWASDILAL